MLRRSLNLTQHSKKLYIIHSFIIRKEWEKNKAQKFCWKDGPTAYIIGKEDRQKGTAIRMKTKKVLHGFLTAAAAVSLILILLLSAFEIAAYSDFGFYQKEYEKYEIQETLPMEMDDIMDVTEKMMSYLRGDREELSVMTTIDGERQDFFNEQDRFHMGEVRDLFLGGFALRRYAAVILAAAVVLLLVLKADLKRILPKAYEITVGVFLALVAALGIAIAVNFDRCFVIFHELFFDNDLWMFDPATDYMIRMLPEGFFFDMTLRIGGFFVAFLIFFELICIGLRIWMKKKEN